MDGNGGIDGAVKLLDLGGGLEVWRANVNALREQDVNARYMDNGMFSRLQATIGRDKRLEQLPFCALTNLNGKPTLEIVSGHHRTRAARAAEVWEIPVLVDVSGLTPDQIRAKQLAHNSISGEDNPQLVLRIYQEIQDVDSRLEAFIDPESLGIKIETVSVPSMDVGLKYRTSVIVWLPYEHELFLQAAVAASETLSSKFDTVLMSELERLEEWRTVLARAGQEYDIYAVGSVMAKMASIVLTHLGHDLPLEEDRVAVRDVLGSAWIGKDAGVALDNAICRKAGTASPSRAQRETAFLALLGAALDADDGPVLPVDDQTVVE